MQILHFPVLPSTNTYLKEHTHLPSDTVVWTDYQTNGRGQMGSHWEVEACKNLTFSIFWRWEQLQARQHFLLNMSVSLAVFSALEKMGLSHLHIKWPNDVLCQGKKISGILIENTLSGAFLQSSIIGIGLNVNQLHFEHLPKATSVQRQMGRAWDLEEALHLVLEPLRKGLLALEQQSPQYLLQAYQERMFRKDKVSTFSAPDGSFFVGCIRGVSHRGELLVELADRSIRCFLPKEITLMY